MDGVLCWAVLMHIPVERLFDTTFNLRRVIRPKGKLLISTPLDGPSVDPVTHRDQDGRLFNQVVPERFQFLLEKVGFRRLNRWDSMDSLGRPGRTWATQAFVLEGSGSRSLETIEDILNQDRKYGSMRRTSLRSSAPWRIWLARTITWLHGSRRRASESRYGSWRTSGWSATGL